MPPRLGQLSELRTLVLHNLELTGRIPEELGRLAHLQELDLSYNRLDYGIHWCLGELSQLERLSLEHNDLKASSIFLANLSGHNTVLRHLDLSHNQLRRIVHGDGDWSRYPALPRILDNFPALEYVDFSHNRLEGPIPPEVGQINQLRWLDLSHNLIEGPIPPELGRLDNLLRLDLDVSSNLLRGRIAGELGQLARLWQLDLSGNVFWGSIPEERQPADGTAAAGAGPARSSPNSAADWM